jgi:ubiquinone/menaquinone biosynthesis C-methylase UbiE
MTAPGVDEGQSIDELLAWRSDELAHIRYLLGLRRYWMDTLYPRLARQYAAAAPGSLEPANKEEARRIIDELPGLRPFLWLDSYIQHRLWEEAGRSADARLETASRLMEPAPGDLGTLELDSELALPEYYTRYDVHHQPGGLWQEDRGAVVYALGARVVHVGRNDTLQLHDAFADDIPYEHPRRVLDMGCGFGKTTFSLKKRYQDAEVVGVDLSAPCLRLARRMATEYGLEVTWRQAPAEHTGEADGSVQIVAMSMLLHEQPPDDVDATLREAHRVLESGGVLVAFEPWRTGDPFRDALGEYHSELTGEPYIRQFRSGDPREALRRAGFAQPSVSEWAMPGAAKASELGMHQWASAWGLLVGWKE